MKHKFDSSIAKFLALAACCLGLRVCADVPTVYITTDDGQPITVKTETKKGSIKIVDANGVDVLYNGAMEIKGRGNTTWGMAKKPYKIKLDKAADLFGFGANKHWVLLANFLDESGMRNHTATDLAKIAGVDAMQNQFVDVYFNGAYAGLYDFCEHIRIEKGDRVDIFDWKAKGEEIADKIYAANKGLLVKDDKKALETLMGEIDFSWVDTGEIVYKGKTYTLSDYAAEEFDVSGGFLYEFDRYWDEASKFKTTGGVSAQIKSPEFLLTSEKLMASAESVINDIEEAWRSEDHFNSKGQHYSELCDIDSMVAFWLVNELTINFDAQQGSRYAQKNIGEKLKFGPIWDFDLSCAGIANTTNHTAMGVSNAPNKENFFRDWLNDPYFLLKICEAFQEHREAYADYFSPSGTYEQNRNLIYDSGVANSELWKPAIERYVKNPLNLLAATKVPVAGFEADTTRYRETMVRRVTYFDELTSNIDRLWARFALPDFERTYWKKAEPRFAIDNAMPYASNGSVAFGANDFKISGLEDVKLTLSFDSEKTVSADVYVNAHKPVRCNINNLVGEISLPKALFDAPSGKRDMIQVIGRNVAEKRTFRNFATVYKTGKGIETYSITYVRNEGAGSLKTLDYEWGVFTRLPAIANGLKWERQGYDFRGWATTTAKAREGRIWRGDWGLVAAPVDPYDNLMVFASWELKKDFYEIRYNKNDGSGRWRTVAYQYGVKKNLPTIAYGLGWSRPGYVFKGWASNAENAKLGKIWKADAATVATAISAGRTLSVYAIWEEGYDDE